MSLVRITEEQFNRMSDDELKSFALSGEASNLTQISYNLMKLVLIKRNIDFKILETEKDSYIYSFDRGYIIPDKPDKKNMKIPFS